MSFVLITIDVPHPMFAEAIADGRIVVYSTEPSQGWMDRWRRQYREDEEFVDVGGES